ncbi:hypothetical protein Talka_02036 [Tepidimonas alkaliphilus]|uniref:Uncharacterized protein n=1 Tax=Tepidimonas alkaliphilus TaxID=2588942 RepID=A0A554W4N4_9BURK|nr:Druantia anti-phage system protein DruA [Tepidimonas alkaliphilus]TSE18539.1 hypothetical protein Talka_02036 [Tepidimonas alkaliphilus]
MIDRHALRQRVLAQLHEQGFSLQDGRLRWSGSVRNKAQLRAFHQLACQHQIERARKALERHEPQLLAHIANGAEIDPARIAPRLIEVQPQTSHEQLFRYARLHWSIPVSAGYGRRLRFLIWDDGHDRLMGILGLADPVFALGSRDAWIGWTTPQRRARLGNVMDAFVLGAVPPYTHLLGGKLAALAAASNEVRHAFERRYAQRITLIANRQTGPLALITTTSALGRSSIYNRLTFQGQRLFHSAGYTRGSGDFPFINGAYHDLLQLVAEESAATAKHIHWGTGFRNRREVVLKALGLLGLPRDLIYHGIAREVFVVPLASNTQAFLRGEEQQLQHYDRPFATLAAYWKQRWALPRAQRDPRYRSFVRESWRLWNPAP